MEQEAGREVRAGDCFLVKTQGSQKEHLHIAITDSPDDPQRRGRAVFVSVTKIRPQIERAKENPTRDLCPLVEYTREIRHLDGGNVRTRKKTVWYCILEAGEHPFLRVKSRVDFSKVLLIDRRAITRATPTEKIIHVRQADPATPALVNKIRQAMPKNWAEGKMLHLSGITPGEYRRILQNECRRLGNPRA